MNWNIPRAHTHAETQPSRLRRSGLPPRSLMQQVMQEIYGKLEALAPRTEAEIVRDFAREHEGITVMAYAG